MFSARNVIGKKSARHDAHVAIRVDSNTRYYSTKARSKLVWNETMEFNIEKASEIEFLVFDRNDGLLGMLFFRLSDLEDELAVAAKNDSVRLHV